MLVYPYHLHRSGRDAPPGHWRRGVAGGGAESPQGHQRRGTQWMEMHDESTSLCRWVIFGTRENKIANNMHAGYINVYSVNIFLYNILL